MSKNFTAILQPCCLGCCKYWKVCGVNFVIYLSDVYQIRVIKQVTGSLRFVYLGLYARLLHNRIRFVFVSLFICVCDVNEHGPLLVVIRWTKSGRNRHCKVPMLVGTSGP